MWPQWPSSSADTKAEGKVKGKLFLLPAVCVDSGLSDICGAGVSALPWQLCNSQKVSARWLLRARNKTLTINYCESHLPAPQPSVAPPALGLMSHSGAFSTEPAEEGVWSVPVSPDPPAARLSKISASAWSRGRAGWGCLVADGNR